MNLDALLGLDLSPETATSLVAGMGALLVVSIVGFGLSARDPMRGRAKALLRRREIMRADLMAPRQRPQAEQAVSFMRSVTHRLNLLRGNHVA